MATIQDDGRYGYQAEGVSPAGVMDRRSAARANVLAGNTENEAVIEVMLGGLQVPAIIGPQDDCFTEKGKERLFRTVYEVSSQSDRMGYRLKEAEKSLDGNDVKKEKTGIEYAGNVTGITDGIVFGSVQIPPSGLPIIMMADRQTTGGYPKIATVITEDIPLLAQSPPGTKIKFREISVEEAQRRIRKQSKSVRLRISGIVSAIFRVHSK